MGHVQKADSRGRIREAVRHVRSFRYDRIALGFNPLPVPVIVTTPAGPGFCEGDTVVLSSQNPWVAYDWSTGDTTATISVIPTVTTTYTVEITDGINTCTDEVTITVKINDQAIFCCKYQELSSWIPTQEVSDSKSPLK